MTFHVGDIHDAAVWIDDPSEIPGAQRQLLAAFRADEGNCGVKFSPVTFEVAAPGDKRLPPPPWSHERCLVGTATVERVGLHVVANDDDGTLYDYRRRGKTVTPVRAFFGDLTNRDKERMIRVTQKAYAEMNPGKPPLSLERCIEYIEAVAPDVWEREMKREVDAGNI